MNFKLAWKQLKNRKISTFIMFSVLCVSMFFMSFTSLYRDNSNLLKHKENLKMYGIWQGAYHETTKDANFNSIGVIESIADINQDITLGSFDKEMMKLSNIQLLEGRYPKNNKEVMVEHSVLDSMHMPYKLNQIISLEVDGNIKEYTIVGILPQYSSNWKPLIQCNYPTVITTNLKGTPTYFVYDDNISSSNVDNYDFDVVNTYSYDELDIDETAFKKLDLRMIYDVFVLMSGLLVTSTVFYQFLLYRKQQIYNLCMLGIKETTILCNTLFFRTASRSYCNSFRSITCNIF